MPAATAASAAAAMRACWEDGALACAAPADASVASTATAEHNANVVLDVIRVARASHSWPYASVRPTRVSGCAYLPLCAAAAGRGRGLKCSCGPCTMSECGKALDEAWALAEP